MRFNAVIAACILAVTVSGAALPTEDAATTDAATITTTEAEIIETAPEDDDDEQFEKRDAARWKYNGWRYRPYGLPVGKREADAEAG